MLHPGAAPSCTISSSGDGVGATRWVNNHDDDGRDGSVGKVSNTVSQIFPAKGVQKIVAVKLWQI